MRETARPSPSACSPGDGTSAQRAAPEAPCGSQQEPLPGLSGAHDTRTQDTRVRLWSQACLGTGALPGWNWGPPARGGADPGRGRPLPRACRVQGPSPVPDSLGEEYRALPGRALLKGWRGATLVPADFLAAAVRASAMTGLRLEPYNSTLRPEKPARAGAASESLGPVKEPARFRGMARISRRDSFLACSGADRPAGSGLAGGPRSPSAASVSEASPSRARLSREARVGRGVDRLLERVSTCCAFWAEPRACSSREAGAGAGGAGFRRGPGRPTPAATGLSWSEVTVSVPGGWARPEPWSSSGQSEDPRGPVPRRVARRLPGSAPPVSVGPRARRCFSESISRPQFKEMPAGSCAAAGDGGFSFGGPAGLGLVGLGPFLPLSRLTVLAVSTSESPDRESS